MGCYWSPVLTCFAAARYGSWPAYLRTSLRPCSVSWPLALRRIGTTGTGTGMGPAQQARLHWSARDPRVGTIRRVASLPQTPDVWLRLGAAVTASLAGAWVVVYTPRLGAGLVALGSLAGVALLAARRPAT